MRGARDSKLISIDAAAGLVPAGATLYVGGMLLSRRPVAFCRELARSGATRLTVVAFTAGLEVEQLIAAGCVERLKACYAGAGLYGPAARIRAAAESGELEWVDETEFTIVAGLQAAVLRLPWFPSALALTGTDYVTSRADIGTFRDPASGIQLVTVPPIRPHVAVVHVPWADPDGNAIFHSAAAVDHAAACAAAVTIVTADRVVTSEELQALGRADLLGFQVQHVVDAPGGALPTSCLPHYEHDPAALLDALEAA